MSRLRGKQRKKSLGLNKDSKSQNIGICKGDNLQRNKSMPNNNVQKQYLLNW